MDLLLHCGPEASRGSLRFHRMDLCVQNDVEHDHPSGFYQVIDAVVVGEDAPNVIGDGPNRALRASAGMALEANPRIRFTISSLALSAPMREAP